MANGNQGGGNPGQGGGSPGQGGGNPGHGGDDKMVTIIVEGTARSWPKNTDISYAQVVTLEFPDFPQHPERTYSVTYHNGHGNKPEGILSPGSAPVKVKDGMIFNVTDSGQS